VAVGRSDPAGNPAAEDSAERRAVPASGPVSGAGASGHAPDLGALAAKPGQTEGDRLPSGSAAQTTLGQDYRSWVISRQAPGSEASGPAQSSASDQIWSPAHPLGDRPAAPRQVSPEPPSAGVPSQSQPRPASIWESGRKDENSDPSSPLDGSDDRDSAT